MKTLDEVIAELEYELAYNNGEMKPVDADALHYLKAFCYAKDTLEREKDRYAEAVKNCERAENIYKQKQKAAEDALWICKEDKDDLTALRAYWAEQQENPPLTWDELQQMEGKPVFVEADYFEKGWFLVDASLVDIWVTGYDCAEHQLRKEDIGVSWQAYRKERK